MGEDPDEVLSKLAETFFTHDKTKVEKAPLKKEKPPKKPPGRILPWIALFIVATVFLTFYIANGRIDININFPAGKPLKATAQKRLLLYSKGGINHNIVKNIEFSGSAIEENIGKHLVVTSGKEPSGACIYFGFKTPLDLGRHQLVFNAKGYKGGEELMVIFRDVMYRSRQIKVAERGLTTDWREFFIDLDDVGVINTGQVKDVRFEFGHSMTDNPPGTTIFLKDIYFAAKEDGVGPVQTKKYKQYEEWYIPDWVLASDNRVINQLVVSSIDSSVGRKSKCLELKVDFPRASSWKEIYVERLVDGEDWTVYKALSAKVFLPDGAPRSLRAKFILTCGEDWHWTEMKRRVLLRPGSWNLIEASLEPISEDWRYRGNIGDLMGDVRKLGIRIEADYSRDYEGSIYVKNIKLAR